MSALINGHPQLWEWVGVDGAGRSQTYQTVGPASETESAMLVHLRSSYRNLTITAIRRLEAKDVKQSTGRVDRHAFQFGIWDECMREVGDQPILRQSLRERFNRDRLKQLAGISRDNYVPIRSRLSVR